MEEYLLLIWVLYIHCTDWDSDTYPTNLLRDLLTSSEFHVSVVGNNMHQRHTGEPYVRITLVKHDESTDYYMSFSVANCHVR